MPTHTPALSTTVSDQARANFRDRVFFHGATDRPDVGEIFRQGFKSEYIDEDGRWFRDGNLGVGIYLSADWRTALWFGNIVIEATVLAGTKIVDTSIPPDKRILEYLTREFGRNILGPRDPLKVIPENKSLRLIEFTALLRHHYFETWHTKAAEEHGNRWSPKRCAHSRIVHTLSRRLLRYGYHGYGHPSDDNGVLILQPERIVPKKILLDVPPKVHFDLTDDSILNAASLENFIGRFGPKDTK